jgi:ribosomal protein S18 acetylase RimI-like enzyme
MQAPEFIGRLVHYGQRHGLRATVQRAWHGLKRKFTGGRQVLFCCDLARLSAETCVKMASGSIERKRSAAEVAAEDMDRVVNAGYPETARRQATQRFAAGASLWLYKLEGQVAAYGWTIAGKTMSPHFHPLGDNDVHLFDFLVFPEYRGRRLNVQLVSYILGALATEKQGRAFIEADEWNTPQLHSLRRMPFRQYGFARKFQWFGKTVTIWSDWPGEAKAAHG